MRRSPFSQCALHIAGEAVLPARLAVLTNAVAPFPIGTDDRRWLCLEAPTPLPAPSRQATVVGFRASPLSGWSF